MKEEKGEGNSYKTVTSIERPNVEVEPIEPRRITKYATAIRQKFSTVRRNRKLKDLHQCRRSLMMSLVTKKSRQSHRGHRK